MPSVVRISARHIASAHTYLAYTAFLSALFLGCLFHYKKIVKNGVAGYPQEWFPSVSATIGDWYPERSVFQLFIALTSGPRFALVFLQYFLHQNVPLLVTGIVRTLSCGGWVYITSSDDHDAHDVFMITYIVCNLPWMVGTYRLTPKSRGNSTAKRLRFWTSTAFFGSLVPLIFFFIRHKVHRIPGAYTHYAFFEWTLIFLDVFFDSIAAYDFEEAGLEVLVQLNSAPPTSTTVKTDAQEKVRPPTIIHPTSEPEIVTKVAAPKVAVKSYISFASDVVQSYLFWTTFTSLIPTLFYFSVWQLGIAGHELAFAAVLSPFLFSILPSGFLSFTRSKNGQVLLNSVVLSGLVFGYLVKTPFARLVLVTPAAIVAVLVQVARWREYDGAAYVTALGLLVHSLTKHANFGMNPLWPFSDYDSWLLFAFAGIVTSLAIYETSTRANITPITAPPRIGTLSAALPLGSLIYTLYSSLSDSSTLIAYTWTGFSSSATTGPHPHTHSPLTLLFQAFGLFLPTILPPHTLSHPAWYSFGCLSWLGVYLFQDWLGYIAGLGSAVFFMSILPSILRAASAARGSAGKVYGTAMLINCLLSLASVWTVAYAFVPGGPYLRERSDLVMLIQMALLAPAFNFKKAPSISLPSPSVSQKRLTQATLALIVILSLLASLFRLPPTIKPYNPSGRIVRAGIWTVHFGMDNKGRDSQRRMKPLLEDMQLDIIGLLETDLHRVVYGNRDLTRYMAETMGFYVDLGPTGPKSHTWGAVLLSKFPIINSTHHLLPSPDGELAPAIEAVLDIYGTEVTVVVSHNGQEETPLDRTLQSIELAKIMSASVAIGRPVIFLGYVVTKPHATRPDPYEIMVTDGQVHDIDDEDADRWCEYILYRGLYRTAYARLSRGIVTDTELQVGQFVVPMPGASINETRPARYLRAWKEQMPTDHWFPMPYYRQLGGRNGHYYHVFGTPLYYSIPDELRAPAASNGETSGQP